jgi:nitrate reductase NapE component
MWKTRQSPLHVTNKTSLTPPPYSEVAMPSQESELSCICVLKVSIFPLFTIFLVGFGTVPTV